MTRSACPLAARFTTSTLTLTSRTPGSATWSSSYRVPTARFWVLEAGRACAEVGDNGSQVGLGEDSNWGVSLKFSDTGVASAEHMGQTPVNLNTSAQTVCVDGGSPVTTPLRLARIATPPGDLRGLHRRGRKGQLANARAWAMALVADIGTLDSWSLTIH